MTELRRAEEALREQATMLLSAQRMGQMGSWAYDGRTGVLQWSDATCELFGIAPADFRGDFDQFTSFIVPADLPAYLAVHAKVNPQAPLLEAQYRIQRPDGSVRWMSERGTATFDSAGAITARIGMVMDITGQKGVADELAQNTMLARVASRVAHIGGWSMDLDENRLSWSDETCAIHEVPAGYMPSVDEGISLFPPEYRDRVRALVQRCIADGTPYEFELPKLTATGRLIWVRSMGEAVRDASGRIVRLQGAFQDITQLRAAQHAARESDERLAVLARASKDAIWDWDLERDTFWCNENFSELCGPGAAVSSQSWQDHIHVSDRQRVAQRIRDAMDGTAATWSETYRIQHPQGGVGHVIGRGYVTRDAAGRAVRMMGSTTDISERMALEERLRQTQRLESVGQLTGGVAHDFNNLLTVILGNSEVLAETLASRGERDPLHGMAQAVVDAALRGAELTKRLLAFARKQALEPRKVDINQLVLGTHAILRRTLGEHIMIEFRAGPKLWAAEVDPAQLDNTLLNLCLNARDAMPDGGRLSIATANVTLDADYAMRYADVQPGEYVMLSVSDTGVGIDPQHIGRVFEPFFTTKEQGKGTGLGLAMTYGFVKQSGGHVNIESQPGLGTTVKLYLPRADGTVDPAAARGAHAEPAGGAETILLVEDDEQVRRYAHAQLVSLGYTVLQAGDGVQALQILDDDEREVDLLFTDVVMPEMGGRELADLAGARRPGLRVLFTSGYAENAIVHDGRLDEGVKLLAKPYRRHELAQAVREILGT